jgi:hypothetical protein
MRVVSILAMRLLVLALLVVGLAACGAGGGGGPSDLGGVPTTIVLPSTTIGAAVGAPAPATPQTVLPAYASLVARVRPAVTRLAVYDAPDALQPAHVLDNPVVVPQAPNVSVPQVLPVQDQQDGWVQVELPQPPNGGTGWVRDADVTITQVSYRMRVTNATGRLIVFGRGRQFYSGPIVVGGAGAAPGHYFLHALFTAPQSRVTSSPYSYGLIAKLSTLLPLGTPVDVVS